MKSEFFLSRTRITRVIQIFGHHRKPPTAHWLAKCKSLHLYLSNFLITFTLFPFIPSLLAHSSLFFTDSEIHLIRQNLLSQNKLNKTTSNSEELYLSAIVYIDGRNWTLWLNNRMIRSNDPYQIKGFRIESVTPFEVKFSWTASPSTIPKTFTLHPNQVFYGKERRVISR